MSIDGQRPFPYESDYFGPPRSFPHPDLLREMVGIPVVPVGRGREHTARMSVEQYLQYITSTHIVGVPNQELRDEQVAMLLVKLQELFPHTFTREAILKVAEQMPTEEQVRAARRPYLQQLIDAGMLLDPGVFDVADPTPTAQPKYEENILDFRERKHSDTEKYILKDNPSREQTTNSRERLPEVWRKDLPGLD